MRVIRAAGRFINKKTVVAGEYRIKARRFVIATGSAPSVPAIPGLDSVPYFTNETIFDNQERLHSLIIIGGGPYALELAQSHSRLGSRVMVLAADKALDDEDPELARVVLEALAAEGISVHEDTKVEGVEGGLGRVRVNVSVGGEKHVVEGSHLLLLHGAQAVGLRPRPRGGAASATTPTASRSGAASRRPTAASSPSARSPERPPYAQVADYHAGIVIRRALFHAPARVDARMIPRVTFTDPELAYVGLSEAEAVKRVGKINVLRWPYRENDRAQAERQTDGHVKVLTARDGTILGAGIVGAQAGELIQMWSLAISQGLSIKAMTAWISPYPTLSEINKRAASSYYATAPSNSRLRKVINFLAKFG